LPSYTPSTSPRYSLGIAIFSSAIACLAILWGIVMMLKGQVPNSGIIYMPMFAVIGWERVAVQEDWDRNGLRLLTGCEVVVELILVVVFVYSLNQWLTRDRAVSVTFFALANMLLLPFVIQRCCRASA
jgi:hypothetical protein